MSNNKTCMKQTKIKTNSEKYVKFSDYLNNQYKYALTDNFSFQKVQNNFSNINQNNLIKYTKLNGSKSILLGNFNSLPLKDDLNPNPDLVKTIKENLSFISANTKYINNIPKLNNRPKTNFLENISFHQNSNNLFQTSKNIFNISPEFVISNNENVNNNINKEINLNQKLNLEEQEISELNIIKDKQNTNNKLNSFLNTPEINISSGEKCIYRQDYYIKQFKVQYSIWLRNILNSKLSSFLQRIKSNKKNIKFYPLNSLKFTANPKYKDNKIFLSMKIKDILIIGIDGNRNSNQKKNKENIEQIEKMGKQYNITDDLIEFLNITMEESINIFYKSEQFIQFKSSNQAKINDNKFYKEKKFSLLENNGFVVLVKNFSGNSKTEI